MSADRQEHAKLLDELALWFTQLAGLNGPRDYVPTPDEVQREAAPQLRLVSALADGAAALRTLSEQEMERGVCDCPLRVLEHPPDPAYHDEGCAFLRPRQSAGADGSTRT